MYYLSDCPRTVNLRPSGPGKDGEDDDEGLSLNNMLGLARRFRKSISIRSTTSGPSESEPGDEERPEGISPALLTASNAATAEIEVTTTAVQTGPLAIRQSPDSFLFVTWDRRSFSVWCSRPIALLAKIVRDENNRRNLGDNQDIYWKPDGLALALITTGDHVIYYSVDLTISPALQFQFSGEHNFVRGPGEGRGIPGCIVQYVGALHVEEGILCGAGMDNGLYVATKYPPGLRRCSLGDEHLDGELRHLSPELTPLNELGFIDSPQDTSVHKLLYNEDLDLLVMQMSNGHVYVTRRALPNQQQQEEEEKESNNQSLWSGWCCHNGSPRATYVALNAYYNLAAIGTENGQVFVYRLPEQFNNAPILSHVLDVPAYSSVKTNCTISALAWSSDGCALAVGRRRGVGLVIHSVFGSLLFHPGREAVTSEDQKREPFLRGVDYLFWGPGDHDLFTWPSSLDDPSAGESLYILPFTISDVAKSQTLDNTKHPLLYADHKLMLFNGELHGQDELGPDAACRQIQLPPLYISENWPVRYVALSDDGQRIAIAGRRGAAHYNVQSRRWKTFGSGQQEQDFVCQGGMLWFHDVLVVPGQDLINHTFQIRFYPRDANLSNDNLLLVELLNAQAVHINLIGSSLTIHCTDNVVYHYGIHVTQHGGVELVLRQHISLETIVSAPGAVRCVCWISTDSRGSTILILVDGQLILINPSKVYESESQLQYERRILASRVEHCFIDDRRIGGVCLTVWAMSADEIKIWTVLESDLLHSDIDTVIDRFPPCIVKPGFSPLVVRVEQGLVIGFEPEMNIIWPWALLVSEPVARNEQEAIMLAQYYEHHAYFGHVLEMLLHRVLEDEVEGYLNEQGEPLMPLVINFLKRFSNYLEVLVKCARKVEVSLWRHLFDVAGPPRDLFNECLATNQLRTATAYLLVLQTLDSNEQDGAEPLEQVPEEAMRLLEKAVDARDFDASPEADLSLLMSRLESSEAVVSHLDH
ncbi:RIC1-domain-containing protein [Syncephalis fuscata]|nr:RIC1-domain-containing protein [Syncephalis fuscata]